MTIRTILSLRISYDQAQAAFTGKRYPNSDNKMGAILLRASHPSTLVRNGQNS